MWKERGTPLFGHIEQSIRGVALQGGEVKFEKAQTLLCFLISRDRSSSFNPIIKESHGDFKGTLKNDSLFSTSPWSFISTDPSG